MAADLKQSTTVTIRMGPFIDAADGVTEKTALTPGIEVSKGHGAFAARSSATAVAHDAEGWYSVELNATDTGTLGKLIVKAHDSANHLPVWHEFMVRPAAVFDSLVGGTDTLPADVTQWNGTAVATPDTAGHPKVTVKTGTGAGELSVTSGAVTAGTVSDKTGYALSSGGVQAIWDALTSALTTASTIGKLLVDNINAAISSRSSHSAADAADAVLDEALSGHTTAGTLGKAIADIETDADAILADTAVIGPTGAGLTTLATAASIAALNNLSAAQVNAEVDTALSDYDGPTNAEMVARTLATADYFDPASDTVRLSATGVDDVLDEAVEGSITLRQALRVLMAFAAAKASGGGTATIVLRDQADTKDRVTMTVDADGNRSAVTLDLS